MTRTSGEAVNLRLASSGGQSVEPFAAESKSAPFLHIGSLTKRYGDLFALKDVSFAIRQSEVLGVIGPNGAGKTTLLETLAGLLPVDGGTVSWRGSQLPQARRREVMFYVPDGIKPYADQHVARVLSFLAGVYGRSHGYVATVVAIVGLRPALSQRVHALSKGFNRRLMLALGFLAPHPLLLMDEPFDGFDLKQTREMMAALRHEVAQGRTLVLSIHQLSDAERMCDRFVLLAAGEVCGTGTLGELRARVNAPDAALEEVFLALT